MEGVVTWPQLAFVAGLVVVANASTAIGVGYIVWHVCQIIAELQKRIARLEILEDEVKRPRPSSR